MAQNVRYQVTENNNRILKRLDRQLEKKDVRIFDFEINTYILYSN